MLPSIALVGSAVVYVAFLCVLGILTGVLIALVSRHRPTTRDMLMDFILAGTAAVASAYLLALYRRARGLTMTSTPSLIPVAVGSVALRHVVVMLRHAAKSHHSKAH